MRQIGQNKYLIDFYEQGRGSSRHQITYRGDLRGAYEEEEWWLRKFGKRRKGQTIKFSDYCDSYREWMQRQKSHRAKGLIINQLEKSFGDYSLISFNRLFVEKYQTEKMKSCKPSTVNRHIATIKHMMTKAYQWGFIKKEVNDSIHEIEMLKENNKRLRYLTEQEANRLIQNCSNHIKPIVILALNTGMRRGEILNLRWEQVDMRNGLILLSQSDTKTGERREIPLNDTALNTLNGIIRHIGIPYVILNPKTNNRITEVKTAFNGACRRARIKDFHFHDLRHTFATWLVMSGVDLTTIQKLLGHKSINMTLRYAHLAPEHLASAVKVLDRINKTVVISSDRKKEVSYENH